MRDMDEKVQHALQGVLARFKSGDIPEAVALATFPPCDIPSAHWSLLNRLIMFLVGDTPDARGYRQWQAVGRYVQRGRKSFAIVAPLTRKIREADEAGEEKEKLAVIGFRAQPVFRVEDTAGEPLDYQRLEIPRTLPLLGVAQRWGVRVEAMPSGCGLLGSFNARSDRIRLASPEEVVFFHELAHAAHHRVRPLKGGQRWDQEIVAELSAAVLCRLAGAQPENLGQSWRYIEHYAADAKKEPLTACAEVIADVERVLKMIMAAAHPETAAA
ncbi:MAG: hypothetical protein PWQ57_2619 [Desulfovibrionales bacterium]|nr:hypothetical protein [Desulfovibrionales bacterium]